MVSLSKQAQQRLNLWQHHCQEQKAFYTAEIEDRRALGRRHEQEYKNLSSRRLSYSELLILLRQQDSELMEFKAIYQEKRWRLKARQDQEKADLEAALKLDNQEVTS